MKPEPENVLIPPCPTDIEENGLWKRIENYSIDSAGAVVPFSRKLAGTENWSRRLTLRAIGEYKRFVYICCISKSGASPPVIVDKVWHMHLLYTVEYWKNFCPNILQRELHHCPSAGGTVERDKHRDLYEHTIKRYKEIFKKDPPIDIWHRPSGTFLVRLKIRCMQRLGRFKAPFSITTG